jgi:rod shape-determining protein MreD
MMRRIYMLVIIACGALLQQALPGPAFFGGIKPPVLAALALHHALRKGDPDFLIAILFAALLRDGLEPGSFGPALLAFPVMGLVARRIRNEIFSDGLVTQLVLGAAMGLFTTLTALLIYTVTNQRSLPGVMVLMRLIGSTLLGMATLPIVSRSVNRLESLIPKRRAYGWQ